MQRDCNELPLSFFALPLALNGTEESLHGFGFGAAVETGPLDVQINAFFRSIMDDPSGGAFFFPTLVPLHVLSRLQVRANIAELEKKLRWQNLFQGRWSATQLNLLPMGHRMFEPICHSDGRMILPVALVGAVAGIDQALLDTVLKNAWRLPSKACYLLEDLFEALEQTISLPIEQSLPDSFVLCPEEIHPLRQAQEASVENALWYAMDQGRLFTWPPQKPVRLQISCTETLSLYDLRITLSHPDTDKTEEVSACIGYQQRPLELIEKLVRFCERFEDLVDIYPQDDEVVELLVNMD